MGRHLTVWLLGVTLPAISSMAQALDRFEFTQIEMAVPVRIVLYAADNATAAGAAQAAFARFRELNACMSDYDPESELRRLCDTSAEGAAAPVSKDLWQVLVTAQQLSEKTDGAFDVTVGPIVKIWRNARRTKELPSPEVLARARASVGYQLLRLDSRRQAVELLRPKMRLDLGGIAKGYAVNEAMAAIRKRGVSIAMVEAGGNIGLGDPPPGKKGWRIGVASLDRDGPPRQYLTLSSATVSTSGDLWQYAVIGGVRYAHLIDPRTATALTNRCSVTVVGPQGVNTDGLSSAVAILGPEKGLRLIDIPGLAAFAVWLIDGKQQIHQTSGWRNLSE